MQSTIKKAIVVGATKGTGLELSHKLAEAGVDVVALGRSEASVAEAAKSHPQISFKVLNTAQPEAASALLAAETPDLVILAGGTNPQMREIHQQTWAEFSETWENDTRMTFEWVKAVLTSGSNAPQCVMTFSSGASVNGSPLSGGYAGAKRMQTFLSSYAQREASRLELPTQFITLLPKQMMAGSDIAHQGARAYASSMGKTEAQFMAQWENPLTAELAATQTLSLFENELLGGKVYALTGHGIELLG